MKRAYPTDQIISWNQEGSPNNLLGSEKSLEVSGFRIQKTEENFRTTTAGFECHLDRTALSSYLTKR